MKDRFQIRKAAGLYWALDMEQSGEPYVRPIPFNECGALLFERYLAGDTPKQLAAVLCETYEIPEAQAREDADAFVKQMQTQFADLRGQSAVG